MSLLPVTDQEQATDRTGRPRQLSIQPGVTFGFPAWSPDGKRIAIVGAGSADTTVSVLDAAATSVGSSPQPTVIYRSADKLPFYLYWEPDGEKVSFLANDGQVLALRVAPADGSAPLDGSGPGSVVRRGAPLYFDWVDKSHLLLHVGSGDASFVGEAGLGTRTVPVRSPSRRQDRARPYCDDLSGRRRFSSQSPPSGARARCTRTACPCARRRRCV